MTRPFRKSERDGYLEIDNRESPGFTPQEAIAAGLGAYAGMLGPGSRVQVQTYNCSHCGNEVMKNPNRTRHRAYCSSCDHDICDNCGVTMKLTGKCLPLKKVFDDYIATGVLPALFQKG